MASGADLRLMACALRVAERGFGRASPNPAVGCLLHDGERVVGQGWHDYDRRDHAEVVALAEAGTRSRGATAYVTLEPCAHQGRTGPCAEALAGAGVRRVVVGTLDPSPRVFGRGAACLRAAGIEVEVGVREAEARRLIEPFACHATTGRPLVVGKVAMSLDGRIATRTGDSRWISGPEARRFGQRLRRRLDALLVGVGTLLADDPVLTDRVPGRRRRPLLRVVLDSRLRTPPGARVLAERSGGVLVFCRPDAPAAARERLEAAGAEVVAVPAVARGVDLGAVLDELGRRGVLGVLVEGGSAVHGSLVEQALVDKIYFIVAPMVVGGTAAVPAIGGEGFGTLAEAARFAVARQVKLGADRILEAYPLWSRSLAAPWRLPGATPSGAPDRARA
jgi:diaminohydroxyphosphoribosylaminopyrimidine deaminase/5-amino-6-(5-phosphoribosylamino)uracil reductase